jgi:AcrR family transcriptional regulator
MSPRAGLDRGRVTDAAVAIADAEGIGAVSIARVAAELGVKGPSLYNHVASRDALVRDVALRGIGELTDALAVAAVGRSGRDALLATARAYRVYAVANPGRYAAGLRAPDSDDLELQAAALRTLDLLRAVMRGFDAGDGEESVHAIRMLRSALHGFVTLEAEGGFAMNVDVDASFDEMLEIFAAGIDARVGSKG